MNNTNNPTQQDLLTQKLSEDGILRLILNDEKRRNALSEEMMAALSESLNQASTNDAVRVIILAAIGPALCSGHDLKQISARRNSEDNGRQYFTEVFVKCSSLMKSITSNSKPIIAEV